MSATMFEQWPQAGKWSLEPIMEWNKITTRFYTEVARQNLKTFNDLWQSQAEQWQGLSHAKGLDDVMSLQARWANKTVPQMYQHAQNIMDAWLAGTSEYSKWFEKEYQQASKTQKNMCEKHGKKCEHE